MNEDDPLEQLKALKKQQGGTVTPHTDPLEQLKAMKQSQPSQQGAGDGSIHGILDKGLDMATFGLHRKGLGVTQAIGDVLQHGFNAHPIDTYNQSVNATKQREQAAETQHPYASAAAEATGFFGTLAAEAPIKAALAARSAASKGLQMLPRAVAEGAPGFDAAIKRIGGSAKTGAATGAVVGGLSSDGDPSQRASAIGAGGILGGLFGGGAQTLGEAGGGLKSLIQNLRTPASELGEQAANSRLAGKLAQDQIAPTDLLGNAKRAQEAGSPALVSHLGGPSLDNTTWLATTGPSSDAARLKQAIVDAQRGEVGVLNRGVTAMSGIENTPANQGDTFLQQLESTRQAAGRRDYPQAYSQPAIDDPNILKAIRRDPDLRASLNQGVSVMRREAELERIQSGEAQPRVVNPLRVKQPHDGPVLNDIGEALAAQGVPMDKIVAAGHVRELEPADLPELPIQMLDYMKQGVGPVIERGLKKGQLSAHDAGIINQKVQSILGQVGDPIYDAARRNQAALFGQIEAGQAGTKAFSQAPEVIAQQLSDLSPTQQNAYRTTQTSNLRDMLNDKKYGSNLDKGIFDNPTMESQLQATYGGEGVNKFAPYREQAQTLNRVNEAATGNSKTAERQGTQGEVVDERAVDAAHLLTSPHRAFYNIPQKLADARNLKIKQVMLQALARKLQIPANSPELPGLVEQLLQAQSTPVGRDVTATLGRRGAIARGGGILSGLLSGRATQ